MVIKALFFLSTKANFLNDAQPAAALYTRDGSKPCLLLESFLEKDTL